MKKSVVTIGTFDGVHKAHSLILRTVVGSAVKNNMESVVVSFKKPVKNVSGLITTEQEKIDIISCFGVDKILLLPINKSVLSMTADEFFEEVLKKELNVKHIVVGYDCAFGKNREGNINWLKKKTKSENIKLTVVKPVKIKNKTVSSSQIRRYIEAGDIGSANIMLDRMFEFSGRHITGNRIGRTIGFPTVNIKPEKDKILPRGVFGCYAADEYNNIFKGVLNIGFRPTVKLKKYNLSAEVHLLDFYGKWKSKNIKIFIYCFLRKEKKFRNVSVLKKAIQKDIDKLMPFS